MTRKGTRIAVLGVIAAAVFAGSSLASTQKTLTIRHQTHGCHSWSLGANWNPSQATTLKRGATIVVVNHDVMPHKLIQMSGPTAHVTTPAMNHMSAIAHVSFPKAGVYVFTTKAGEDYMKGVKTTGEDNVLHLKVTVR